MIILTIIFYHLIYFKIQQNERKSSVVKSRLFQIKFEPCKLQWEKKTSSAVAPIVLDRYGRLKDAKFE